MNRKLDNLAEAVQSLSDRVDEAESQVEQVEGRTEEATKMLCTYLKQQSSKTWWREKREPRHHSP